MVDYIKKVAKGASVVVIIIMLSSFLGYLIRLYLTKSLSPEEFGLVYAVFTFISFLWLFKHFGMNGALVKFIPEFLVKKEYSKIKSLIISVLVLEFFFAIIISLILIFLSNFLSTSYFKVDSARGILIILIFYFLISVISELLASVFLGFQKVKYYALNLFLTNSFVLLFIILFTKKVGIYSLALGYVFSAVMVSVIFFGLFLRMFSFFKFRFIWSDTLIKKLVFFSLPLMLTMIGGKVIGYMDTLLLTYFRTLSEVGVYNVVLPTALLLTVFGNSLGTVLFPMVSELCARDMKSDLSSNLRLIHKYVFVFVTPIGLIILSFPKIVLRVLFGEFYISGAISLQILIIGVLLYTVAVINTCTISGFGRPKEVTKIILIAAFINLLGNLLLIPFFGINGAAFSTFLSYLIIFILSSLKLSTLIDLKIPWLGWLKTCICGGVMVSSVYLLKNFLELSVWLELIVVISAGLIIYSILCYMLKLIKISDIRSIIKLLN